MTFAGRERLPIANFCRFTHKWSMGFGGDREEGNENEFGKMDVRWGGVGVWRIQNAVMALGCIIGGEVRGGCSPLDVTEF
jgi:hypothetical protein